MAKDMEIRFSIETFDIRHFSFSKPDAKVRKDRLNFNIDHSFNSDTEKQIFHVSLQIRVEFGKQNPAEIAEIETLTSFKLKGLPKGDGLRIPDQLMVTFLSIAYSNTRGALAAKAQGTVAGDIPLPLINPVEIVNRMKETAESSS